MTVQFTRSEHIAEIVLDRPTKLNTVTPEMAAELRSIAEQCNVDNDIRCVIFTGSGEKAFCAGSDVKELDYYDSPWHFRNRADYCDSIRAIKKPVIGAVNGYAYGGGLELALSCDIRLASENASFCAAEIKLGWIGGGGVTYMLVHNIGASNAATMLLTGDPVGAAQARDWGLVSAVHEPAELLPAARDLAAKICRNAPVAAVTAKDNIRAAYTMPREMAVIYERDLQTICMATEDAAEGQAAFREKRPAKFTGR